MDEICYVIFSNDWPLAVVIGSQQEADAEVEVQRAKAREHHRVNCSGGDVKALNEYMQRCYFHWHDVPLVNGGV